MACWASVFLMMKSAPAWSDPLDCADPQSDTNFWVEVAPGVHIWPPPGSDDPSPQNGGHVMPTTVLQAGGEAWVVDPGPHHAHGLQVRRFVECQLRAAVTRIINSHAHSENVLANSAFADLIQSGRAEVLALSLTAQAMAKRCAGCLSGLTQAIGSAAMAGTRILLPTQILQPFQRLQLGPIVLEVREAKNSHTESDLILWAPDHGVLWMGGLVVERRLPELAQGSLLGWIETLEALPYGPVNWMIGTGLVHSPEGIPARALAAPTLDYLKSLRDEVLQRLNSGEQVPPMAPEASPRFRGWAGAEERHGFNLQRAWRELEGPWIDGKL